MILLGGGKMVSHRKRGQEIINFLLEQMPQHSKDVVRVACDKFGITRQAVNRYMSELEAAGFVIPSGNTKRREYRLRVLCKEVFNYDLQGLDEDLVWRDSIGPHLCDLPENSLYVWQYCISEMINNAIDHSGGARLVVSLEKTAAFTELLVHDDGIGIFKKIKEEFHLEDERHAILELAKGKLTTDPARHTGEGIFFTSRMLDNFRILSGGVFFTHEYGKDEDWIVEHDNPRSGTSVLMKLANNTSRTTKEIFDEFASDEHDYGFTKTVVPVRLARHGTEQLVSRSQAKRLLARVDRFSIVIFDFKAIESIGQAFADEIFRVFERSHPNIKLVAIHTSAPVDQMINRARAVSETADALRAVDNNQL
jgi:anti-sigma regulatory factor (Ser/Thr protein kinase)/biotin operon repressor